MIKSRRTRKYRKPKKPYDGFPLFPHVTKRWAKKIHGKFHYFGSWDDGWENALNNFNQQKEAVYLGKDPKAPPPVGPTVHALANAYLNHKKMKLERGELSARSFGDQHTACARVVDVFGPDRLLADIGPDRFAELEAGFPTTWGPKRRGREITQIRALFHFAEATELITRVRFGTFRQPGKDVLQRHRAKQRATHGLRLFTPEQLRAILAKASTSMKAMVLLGVNAGLGNTDLAALPAKALDLEGGWLNYPRPKTGVDRRVPLWPETVTALREVIAQRPAPHAEADAGLVFLSARGLRWVRIGIDKDANGKVKVTPDDAISRQFRDLLKDMDIWRPGLSFYTCRHCTETIGSEAGDQIALDAIMGHVDGTMAATYRERIGDDRLQKVTDHVRDWLFAGAITSKIQGDETSRL
jgi:integrase